MLYVKWTGRVLSIGCNICEISHCCHCPDCWYREYPQIADLLVSEWWLPWNGQTWSQRVRKKLPNARTDFRSSQVQAALVGTRNIDVSLQFQGYSLCYFYKQTQKRTGINRSEQKQWHWFVFSSVKDRWVAQWARTFFQHSLIWRNLAKTVASGSFDDCCGPYKVYDHNCIRPRIFFLHSSFFLYRHTVQTVGKLSMLLNCTFTVSYRK